MILNRIINDIIDWIRRLLYWKKSKVVNKPYTVLETTQGTYGVIKKVDRDTPRAVLTYIFTPKINTETNIVKDLYDYHICLDHLWSVDNPEINTIRSFTINNRIPSFRPIEKKSVKQRGKPSHTITVLKASRWLDKKGNYQTSLIYYNEFDFIGIDTTPYRDKYAAPILKDVMAQLKYRKFNEFNWEFEINCSQKKYMGSYYVKRKEDITE